MIKKGLVIGLVVFLQVVVLGCKPKTEGSIPIKEVVLENRSNYIFKKIYVKDKLGRTHEILTSSSGNTMGGVGMIELCVYREN